MGKKQRYLSVQRDRMQIMWLHRQCALFARLSLNVIREFCSYFSMTEAKLVMLAYSQVLYFDTKDRRGKTLFPLVKPVRTTLGYGYLWLSDTQVFACGPNGNTLMLTPSGNFSRASLHHSRCQHGLIFVPQRQAVYVFGGTAHGFFGLRNRRSGERHDLISNKWTLLSRMSIHRRDFQPCLYHDLIIICGGCISGTFEAYNITTELYSPINFSIAPGSAMVVNEGDVLITYCSSGLVKWRFRGEGSNEVEMVGICPAGSAIIETQTQPLHIFEGTFYANKGEFYRIAESLANRQQVRPSPRQNNTRLRPAVQVYNLT